MVLTLRRPKGLDLLLTALCDLIKVKGENEMNIQEHKITNIRFSFDGIQGYHANYGAGSEGRDYVMMGLGRTYGEALNDAMEMLAESTDIDLGYFSDPSEAIEKAFDRAAAEAGIDPESTAEVDAMDSELEGEDDADEEFSMVGLVLWFDAEEVNNA